MKTVKIPSFFRELFGDTQRWFEIIATLCFAVFATAIVLVSTLNMWVELGIIKMSLLILLYLDITGGLIANLSFGTNQYYSVSVKRRLVFIAIHIQPLLLAYIFHDIIWICIGVWGYTIFSTLLVNNFYGHESQRVLGGFMLFSGLIGLFLIQEIPVVAQILLIFFMIKVIFSFGVNHYESR